MKGIICYHSQSGNTALTCRYLSQKLQTISFDLVDIVENPSSDLSQYDVVGFATWTYFMGLPPFFEHFLQGLPPQPGKPVFILSTFGMMSGQVLKQMEKSLTAKGCIVFAGHAFHTPESYPLYVVKGWGSENAPTTEEMEAFEAFITRLDSQIDQIQAKTLPGRAKIKLDLFSHLIRPYSIEKARREMGVLSVDPALCTQCGTCQDVCLYQAVGSNLPPTFDAQNCHGCWACFNHCPQKAIFTGKVRGVGHYPQPAEALIARLDGKKS